MPTAWRLVKTRFASTAFDGEGARVYGARWNSPGVAVAYAADSPALAVLEVLVHLQSSRHLDAYSLVSARIPDEIIEVLPASALPPDWTAFPPPPETQAVGDEWIASRRSAVLRVPSAIVPRAEIFLMNPAHADLQRVATGAPLAFRLDPRFVEPGTSS